MRKFLYYFGLIIIFLLPLVFADMGVYFHTSIFDFGTQHTYELPKTVFFVITGGIWIIAYSLWKLFRESPSQSSQETYVRKIQTYALYAFLIFLSLTVISNFFSPVGDMVFWGTTERMGGLLPFLSVLIFSLIFVSGFLTTKESRVGFHVTVVASALIVSIISILQWFKLDPIVRLYSTDFMVGRSFGTLGNPNYLATFLLFAFPSLAILIFHNFTRRKLSILLPVIFIIFLALIFSESRAGMLGFAVFVAVAIISCLKSKLNFKHITAGLVAGIILLSGVFYLKPVFSGLPLISRIYSSSDNLRSMNTRIHMWGAGLKLIEDRPLLGWGFDSLSYAFLKYQTPALFRSENLFDRPDRLHNHFMDITYSSGIPAVLAYLILLVTVFYFAFRYGDIENRIMASGLIGVLAADQFGFFVISHKLYFWIFLFMIFPLLKPEALHIRKYLKISLTGCLIILSAGMIYCSSRIFLADQYYYLASKSTYRSKLEALDKAVSLWPLGDDYINKLILHPNLPPEAFEYYLGRAFALSNYTDIYPYLALGGRNDIDGERKSVTFQKAFAIAPVFPPLWVVYLDYLRDTDTEGFKTGLITFINTIPDIWKIQYKENPTDLEKNKLRIFWKNNPVLQRLVAEYEKIK